MKKIFTLLGDMILPANASQLHRKGNFFRESFTKYFKVLTASVLFCITLPVETQAQVRLVADLNTNETESYFGNRFFDKHQSTGNRSFFVTDSNELWTSDGTAAGTIALKTYFRISELKVSGNIAFFSAFTYEHGYELWKSDGTESGTVLLKDLYPGTGDGSPSFLTDVNGTLYFSANNSTNGRELWKSDGTPGGTVMVKDIKPGSTSSNVQNIVPFNNSILFSANDGINGYELWISDGTETGTAIVDDIYEGTFSSAPGNIAVANGVAYFSASVPVIDRQLWKSDGTAGGTSLVKVIRAGGRNPRIDKMTAVGPLVFFEADDGIHGLELWRSDGTDAGTILIKDITPGPESASTYSAEHIEDLTAINGKLFFTGTPVDFAKFYVSDGTPAGTVEVGEGQLNFSFTTPGFGEFSSGALFQASSTETYSNNLYFSDGTSISIVKEDIMPFLSFSPQFLEINSETFFFGGETLYTTDGTGAGTIPIKNLHRKGSSNPTLLTDAAGTLFFAVTKDSPPALYKTNGAPEGTVMLKNLNPLDGMASLGTSLFFCASGYGGGYRPWTSDGTPEGTIPLSSDAGLAQHFAASNGLMFFNARGPLGEELWKSDGTPGGTSLVLDAQPGSVGSFPKQLIDVNNTLFFAANTTATGNELWKSDGTPGGTMLVKDIRPGQISSGIYSIISFKNKTYFIADDGVHGTEIWASNGTDAGTYMITDQDENFDFSYAEEPFLVASGNSLYFTTINSSRKLSVWKTNGEPGNMTKLKEFDVPFTDMVRIVGANSQGVFIARRTGSHFELWRSWGTPSTTVRVRLFRNHGYYEDNTAAVLNDVLYFGAGEAIWRSDGTGAGTYQLPFHGESYDFTSSGQYVYFNGESIDYGYELFLIDESTTATTSLANVTESQRAFAEAQHVAGYPNPFRSTLTIRVDAAGDDTFDLNVTGTNGQQILKAGDMSCNVDHTVGTSWNPGLYFVQIRHNNKVTTKKIIKIAN